MGQAKLDYGVVSHVIFVPLQRPTYILLFRYYPHYALMALLSFLVALA